VTAFRLALRNLVRDLKSGEIAVLLLALMVAVASLTAVGFFADRLAEADLGVHVPCRDAANQLFKVVFDFARRLDDDATARDGQVDLLLQAERSLLDRGHRQPNGGTVAPFADDSFHDLTPA